MISENIHANALSIFGKGVLIFGPSGSGKSDISLRLILNHNAVLISDDRTIIQEQNGVLSASCPKNIKGLLEIRGIGICNFPCAEKENISLAIELVKEAKEIERMPQERTITLLGINVPLMRIYAFEVSAAEKIVAAICYQKKENSLPFKSD